ncbi:adenosylcobinamide-phosphate synthase [Melghirimyces profundicolus]|uniref:Cobalamin biosynthesis protein CobD n=1 Tax=Melghirimyces profundicolus TaxID=1242148 RepID=A0A2T6C7K7_9BACL|nr:adenosylcobinamide-phosphate synthase CbiB [Melghirimyces profundicolus]PTX64309.1 adenosylcobinamide-phosphate synthase [Melghirimyces profundicolus]
MIPWALLLAHLIDRIVGDPRRLPHPVVGMGWLITRVEKLLHPLTERKPGRGVERLIGCLLPLTVVGSVWLLSFLLLSGVGALSRWAAFVLEVWLIATTLATRGLADAALSIYRALAAGNLAQARKALSMVVGRDTEELDEPEVVRGAVETTAENLVDAVTAPLFFAAVGGAPLALAYRAVNTLDSMVGYKDERYLHLGWASARLDDLANWLPARLTVLPLLTALWWTGHSPRRAWRILRRDAGKHPSPNSGITESLMAGGLGIQLGGTNRYRGTLSHRAFLGDPSRPKEPEDIRESVRILKAAGWVYVLLLALICYTVSG